MDADDADAAITGGVQAVSTGGDVAAAGAKNVSPQTLRNLGIAAAVALGLTLSTSLLRRSRTAPSEEVLETVSAIDEGAPDSA